MKTILNVLIVVKKETLYERKINMCEKDKELLGGILALALFFAIQFLVACLVL